MDLNLRAIDENNWEECVSLEVHTHQEHFVASNWYSILQAQFSSEWCPLSIYDNKKMIGFLMYGVDSETNRLEMCRLMVDKNHQQKGYGKAAVLKLLALIKEKYGHTDFYTSVEPDNMSAIKLYEDVGFRKTGEIMWDEIVMKKEVK